MAVIESRSSSDCENLCPGDQRREGLISGGNYPGQQGLVNEMEESSWQIIVAIIAAIAVISGYMYNSWQHRKLERNKIQYEAKLAAFGNLIAASRGSVDAYEMFRALVARISDKHDPLEAIIVAAALTQDLEKPLESASTRHMLERATRINDELVSNRSPRMEELKTKYKDEVQGLASSLGVLLNRIFHFHHERFAVAYESATLVMEESEEFVASVKNFVEYLYPAFLEQDNRIIELIDELGEDGLKTKTKGYSEDETLKMRWGEMLRVMNGNLRDTL